MNQDPISGTTATYDEIADVYAERWQERGVINAHIDRFAELLPLRWLAR